jgi:hypothetical protein
MAQQTPSSYPLLPWIALSVIEGTGSLIALVLWPYVFSHLGDGKLEKVFAADEGIAHPDEAHLRWFFKVVRWKRLSNNPKGRYPSDIRGRTDLAPHRNSSKQQPPFPSSPSSSSTASASATASIRPSAPSAAPSHSSCMWPASRASAFHLRHWARRGVWKRWLLLHLQSCLFLGTCCWVSSRKSTEPRRGFLIDGGETEANQNAFADTVTCFTSSWMGTPGDAGMSAVST